MQPPGSQHRTQNRTDTSRTTRLNAMTLFRTTSSKRRYRGRSTDERRMERRQRLLAAGTRLIGRKGYAALTIERLCTDARVSPRYFYEQFSGREDFLIALFDEIAGEAQAVVLTALNDSQAPAAGVDAQIERMLDAVAAFVRHTLADPDRARIAFVECVGVSPQVEARRRQAVDRFVSLIADAAQRLAKHGALPRGQYRIAAIALVGATNELLVEWMGGSTGLDAEQMERAIIALFRTLISGARATAAAGARKPSDPNP